MDKLKGIWTKLKSEFMKIIFPSNEKILADSVTVLVCSLVLGGIIFLFDSVISFGLSFLFK